MPFDANLVLAAGNTGTYDWDYANLVTAAAAGGAPVSLTINAGGFVVLDIRETAANGLAVVFIGKDSAPDATDYVDLKIQSCDSLDFSSDPVHELCTFDILAAVSGRLLGSELPCTIIRRVATTDQYLRAYAVCDTGDDMGECWVLVAPWPFFVL